MKGNNIDLLKSLPDNSIDSVVTDPPYGLSFMNKKWDYDVPSIDFWTEVYRVLKPGGHVLSFGGTRTYHRMVVNMEDAGFEIRDQIMWLYGSGFPKSHNIGKAVDKINGIEIKDWPTIDMNNESEVGKISKNQRCGVCNKPFSSGNPCLCDRRHKSQNEYEGWGTALKPANEPICLARKPLSEKSVAENVLKWRTGGINVDGCRIGNDEIRVTNSGPTTNKMGSFATNPNFETKINEGRFPANIILECICDEVIKGEKGEIKKTNRNRSSMKDNGYGFGEKIEATDNYNDKGDIHTNPMCPCRLLDEQSYSSSRFFYQAKVSKDERNMGLDGFEEKQTRMKNIDGEKTNYQNENVAAKYQAIKSPAKNNHPTVKPINLLTYLCRLVTPPNGIVLDPFMGSGSTGIAAQLEGFRFCGMEMDEDYFKIAEARIENYKLYEKFHIYNKDLKNGNTRMASRNTESNSLGLGICKKK